MTELTDQYSIVVWILSVTAAFLSFPIGVVIPIYFYIKADNGTGREQGLLEVSAVLAFGILGIIAVELGGRIGAIVAWVFVGGVVVLLFVAVLLATAQPPTAAFFPVVCVP